MEPIFDRSGRTVGFQHDDRLLDLRGRSIAFLRNGSVFSYRGGRHVGWWQDGHLRSSGGGVVAFVRGAQNLGVIPPIPRIPPIPPIPAIPPIPPIPAIPPVRSINRLSWSNQPYGHWIA